MNQIQTQIEKFRQIAQGPDGKEIQSSLGQSIVHQFFLWRYYRKISLRKAAALLECDSAYLYRIEGRKQRPSRKILQKIVGILFA